MNAIDDFQKQQQQFAAHLRNPNTHAKPADIEDRRMKIYRDLFYNNINNFLRNGFPVIYKIFTDDDWHKMVRDFFHRHISTSPYFSDIAQEFLNYLQTERTVENDLPFLLELAHYEWVELALDISDEEIPSNMAAKKDDILHLNLSLSPLAWSLHYQYPVHQITPEFIPTENDKNETFIIVYRNRQDKVKFLEINAVTARLVYLLEMKKQTGLEVLQQLASEISTLSNEKVIASGQKTLSHLNSLDILFFVED